MRVLVRLVLAAATAATLAAAADSELAADIDVAFLQDGRTTYCQGVREDEGSLVFETLKTTSAGKCPVLVAIDVAQKTLPTVASPLAVSWAASQATINAASSLFPRAINADTGKPQDIIASLLVACKAGSNCVNQDDVVIPAAIGSADQSVGAFDASGKKTLRSYQFQFPAQGEYVVVGKVVLPGDAALNISATEFVSFQTVQVGVSAGSGDGAGTVKPADSSQADTAPVRTTEEPTTPPNINVHAETTDDAELNESGSKNLMLIAVLAGVGAIGVVAAFAISRRQARSAHGRNNLGFHDDTANQGGSIYRLDHAPARSKAPVRAPMGAPAPMPRPPQAAAPPAAPAAAAVPPPRRQFKKQPRYFENDSVQSQDAPIHAGVAAHRPQYHSPDDMAISIDPFTQSTGTSLNSLHDSTIRLPRRYPASDSSSSVYTDSLGGASEDSREFSEINIDHGLMSSEQTIAPMRPTDMTDLSEYDDQLHQSTYSWVYSDSDLTSFHQSSRSTHV